MRLPRRRTLWISAVLLLAVVISAWLVVPESRVTPENFNRLSMRMSKDEVYAILGEPTEVGPSINEGLIRAEWRTGPKSIYVEFRSDRVCTLGQAWLHKTKWQIVLWYVKTGAEKVGVKWD
jgi:hypothetical protein